MGGAHVFPGGRVDAGDRDVADATWCDGMDAASAQLGDLPVADALAFRVAALRELFEEAGVLLARSAVPLKTDPTSGSVAPNPFVSLAGEDVHARFTQYRADVHSGTRSMRDVMELEHVRLALDAVVSFAHWVTPPIDVRQFDTRFFLTRVPPDQVPVHDDSETTHSTWVTPADALMRAVRDEIVLPPPTWTTLRELESFRTVDDALAWARQRRIVRRMPQLVERDGLRMLVLPGDPLHPERTDDPPLETRFVHMSNRWRAERSHA